MPASAKGSIVIRDLATIEEFRAVEDLQIEAWGDDERDIVPLSQLVGASCVGGSVIGAFDGERLVGFAYGFYGHLSGMIVHHSHMLAVSPDYRSHNLGFELKAAQRKRVLTDKITDRMTWTFDPLQSLNAHFNFRKLGVVSDTYKINAYGENASSFLHRNGTDRLLVTWLLNSPKVNNLIDLGTTAASDPEPRDTVVSCVLRNSGTDVPELDVPIDDAGEAMKIEIPRDIGSIEERDFDLAKKWREMTRLVFSEAVSKGFVVTDYFLEGDRTAGSYFLKKTTIEQEERSDQPSPN